MYILHQYFAMSDIIINISTFLPIYCTTQNISSKTCFQSMGDTHLVGVFYGTIDSYACSIT